MQIRELSLKELDTAWDVVSQLRTQMEYKEFEDLVYEMRESNYTMMGIFEREKLITYAGVRVEINLYHKRHLYIHELVTDASFRSRGYGKMMLGYLEDYAKVAACENIVLSSAFHRKGAHGFYEQNGFDKKSFVFLKTI